LVKRTKWIFSTTGEITMTKYNSENVSFALGPSNVPTIQHLDPQATGLGLNALIWHGDDLPNRVGGPPRGYVTKTYMTQWLRGSDDAGYMSFGPYFEPGGIGRLFQIRCIMSLDNHGGNDEDVLTFDCVDHNDGGRALIPSATFKVRDFPSSSESWGFIIFSIGELEIKPGMSIETRVFAHGGASLYLYQLRYDFSYR